MTELKISDKTSQFYDSHWLNYPLEINGVVEHLKDLFPEGLKGKTVLDAGCGSGIVSIAFSILGADVLGIDASPKCVMLSSKRAEKMGVQAQFEQHDLTLLDLGGRSFDIIYCWGVLHHTVDAQQSFNNIIKYMNRERGVVVIAVYLKTCLSGFWNFTRVFYQNSPPHIKTIIRFTLSKMLDVIDILRRLLYGKQPPSMRGTRNEELVNDWFGVPQRSFHTYEEVFGWFKKNELDYKLTNPATGRFKSTSNFEVMGCRGSIIFSTK